MGARAEEMIRVALDAFAERDVESGRVARRARRADRPREPPARSSTCSRSASDLDEREWGLRMLIVSRCLERIGDHAVDIGEQTAYLVTGEFREFTDASQAQPGRRVASPRPRPSA